MTGKFTCRAADDGNSRLNLLACNWMVLLTGRGCRSRSACLRSVEAVRRRCADAAHFEERLADDGRFYFVLKSSGGEVIGTSRSYPNRAACRRGIASVQRHAAEARVAAD